MRLAFLVIGSILVLSLLITLLTWVLILGPGEAWSEFIEYCNRWGNVASVLGVVLGMIGFAVTFFGFWFVFGEQARIRAAVSAAVGRAASTVISSATDEAERLLLGFLDAVREKRWTRAGEKCDDAGSQVSRILDNPHLLEKENRDLAAGVDNLHLVSNYLTIYKALKDEPAEGFHEPKLEAVHRLITALRTVRSRIQKRVWEV